MNKSIDTIKVDESKVVADTRGTVSIKGLEEVPSNIIPVPFYKLVQPGSTNVSLADGEDAAPGYIFMMDSGTSTSSLKFALLRAKRIPREFTNDRGELVNTVTMGVLGINVENFSPFILSVSVASFSNFGRLMKQFKDKKADCAWKYPITITSEKREEVKDTGQGTRTVKYYVLNFAVANKPFEEEELNLLSDAYEEFAGSLDRNQETDAKPTIAKVEKEEEEDKEEGSGIPF